VFSSIRVRLTFSHLAVIILAMGLSGVLLLSFLERYFLQATEDSLIAQARITAQALIPGAITEGPQPSPGAPGSVDARPGEASLAPAYNAVQQQQLSNLSLQAENLPRSSGALSLGEMDLTYLADASLRLSAQLETRIRILDARGVVLVDSQQEDRGKDLRADSLVARALDGGYASRTDQAGGEAAMHVSLPVLVEDRLVGVVYLSQPLRDTTAVLRDLRARWLSAMAIALLLSGVAGLLLSGAIASPLRRLTAAAGAVAQGQLDQQVPVRSRDEVGRLSRVFNDMTARLQSARQMQVDFVANVSHELRTPLTSIKGMVETLRAGAIEDPEVRDRFLETAESETDRLIRLVNDLLLLSRADSEALNLRRESRDLTELVRATLDRMTSQAEVRELVLKMEASPDAPLAWVDPDRIEQVLVNLLDNAIKYSRPGGTVTVQVTAGPDQSALVQVCDEGIGVPAKDLPYIGQRFYRADKARSRTEGGSGLGLAIARALVQAHGGRLWLESQEGQGTVASFTLPSS
jgi:two-component system OmpR family sensor kinase